MSSHCSLCHEIVEDQDLISIEDYAEEVCALCMEHNEEFYSFCSVCKKYCYAESLFTCEKLEGGVCTLCVGKWRGAYRRSRKNKLAKI